jgi:hypothetical protein
MSSGECRLKGIIMIPYMSKHKRDKLYSNFGKNLKPQRIPQSQEAPNSPQQPDQVFWRQSGDEAQQAPGDNAKNPGEASQV